MLPVVGCGTWQTFDVGAAPAERAPRAEVLKVLFEAGGSVIDSSPMYGAAEGVVGDLLAAAGTRDKAFLATKVWTLGRDDGIAQMEQSMQLLRTDRIDLMQIHNLVDWQTHLPTLQGLEGRGPHPLMSASRTTPRARTASSRRCCGADGFDFVQINYALDERGVERSLLRFAANNGVAVIDQPAVRRRRAAAQALEPPAARLGRARSAARAGRRSC